MQIRNEVTAMRRAQELTTLLQGCSKENKENYMRELELLEAVYPVVQVATRGLRPPPQVLRSTFERVRHKVPIPSLVTATHLDDVEHWASQVSHGASPQFAVTFKNKGVSIAVTYVAGRLTKAVTQGDGISGINITENVKQVSSIPHRISHLTAGFYNEVVIRYEIFCTPIAAPDKAGADIEERVRKAIFARNPNQTKTAGLQAVASDILYADVNVSFANAPSDKMFALKDWGLQTNICIISHMKDVGLIATALSTINALQRYPQSPIEGVLIRSNKPENPDNMPSTLLYIPKH